MSGLSAILQMADIFTSHLAIGVLKELSTRQKKEALRRGSNELPELIFNRDGKIIEQNHIRRAFNRVLKKAKIRHVKLHTLRHTFASLLLSMGESPVYVKEQLGHHSIQITVDIYGHWMKTKPNTGVNCLDNAAPKPHPPRTHENIKAITR